MRNRRRRRIIQRETVKEGNTRKGMIDVNTVREEFGKRGREGGRKGRRERKEEGREEWKGGKKGERKGGEEGIHFYLMTLTCFGNQNLL